MKKDLIFKFGDNGRLSKYKNIFAKDYTPNCFEDFFVIHKVKKTVRQTYIISDLQGEKIIEILYKKELQKRIKESLGLKK